jgi:hypothetical protein
MRSDYKHLHSTEGHHAASSTQTAAAQTAAAAAVAAGGRQARTVRPGQPHTANGLLPHNQYSTQAHTPTKTDAASNHTCMFACAYDILTC